MTGRRSRRWSIRLPQPTGTADTIALFYKGLLFITFDPEVAPIFGVRSRSIDTLFSLALAATIVASIKIVGVMLIAATLIIPAATARLLTDSFSPMLLLSAALGAAAGLLGMYVSYWADISSGATIVLIEAAGFGIAFVWSSVQGRRTAWHPGLSRETPLHVASTGQEAKSE